ncbi:hypothetical protein JCM10213_000309 [Rhodosporidiobolus nylandii]
MPTFYNPTPPLGPALVESFLSLYADPLPVVKPTKAQRMRRLFSRVGIWCGKKEDFEDRPSNRSTRRISVASSSFGFTGTYAPRSSSLISPRTRAPPSFAASEPSDFFSRRPSAATTALTGLSTLYPSTSTVDSSLLEPAPLSPVTPVIDRPDDEGDWSVAAQSSRTKEGLPAERRQQAAAASSSSCLPVPPGSPPFDLDTLD